MDVWIRCIGIAEDEGSEWIGCTQSDLAEESNTGNTLHYSKSILAGRKECFSFLRTLLDRSTLNICHLVTHDVLFFRIITIPVNDLIELIIELIRSPLRLTLKKK